MTLLGVTTRGSKKASQEHQEQENTYKKPPVSQQKWVGISQEKVDMVTNSILEEMNKWWVNEKTRQSFTIPQASSPPPKTGAFQEPDQQEPCQERFTELLHQPLYYHREPRTKPLQVTAVGYFGPDYQDGITNITQWGENIIHKGLYLVRKKVKKKSQGSNDKSKGISACIPAIFSALLSQ